MARRLLFFLNGLPHVGPLVGRIVGSGGPGTAHRALAIELRAARMAKASETGQAARKRR